jgi:hypothetical protein
VYFVELDVTSVKVAVVECFAVSEKNNNIDVRDIGRNRGSKNHAV